MTTALLALTLLLIVGLAQAVPVFWESPPDALPPLPTYTCPRVAEPPALDGRLDDAAWEKAPEIHLVRCISATPPAQATTVRMVWDGQYLYLGFRVAESDIQDHNRNRDDFVFNEQCVEVFLAHPSGVPATAGGDYRYLEADVSPTGVLFDASILKPAGQGGIEAHADVNLPGLRVATQVKGTLNDPRDRDAGWTCEYAIPLEELPGWRSPLPGEVWRLNLYRIHNWEGPDTELQAWSPTGAPNFHLPERFGFLRFGEAGE